MCAVALSATGCGATNAPATPLSHAGSVAGAQARGASGASDASDANGAAAGVATVTHAPDASATAPLAALDQQHGDALDVPPPQSFRAPGAVSGEVAKVAASPVVAVAELDSVFSECSNAGGIHTIYRIAASSGPRALQRAHGGGHSVEWLPGLTEQNTMGAGKRRIAPGRWFVLGLRATGRIDEDHDDNPDSGMAGWCLNGMPRADSLVEAAVPVASRAEGEELAHKLGRTFVR